MINDVTLGDVHTHTSNSSEIKIRHKTSGITLISLIITIIVLLILAGITINAITGSENAMEKGKEAKTKTEQAAETEQLQLILINMLTNNNLEKVTLQKLKEELINNQHLNISIKTKKLFHDQYTNRYWDYDNSILSNCNQNTISKALKLQGKDEGGIKIEDFYIVSYKDKADTYIIDSNGKVERFFPFCNVCNVKTSTYNGKKSHQVSFSNFVSDNYKVKEYGIIYGTNRLLGADTTILGYATTPYFSKEYLENNLCFSDDSRTSAKQACKVSKGPKMSYASIVNKFDYVLGNNLDAYAAYRGYLVYEDIYTHEETLVYSEPVYVTYNLILALE